jgi:hypothetical protein
MAQESPRASTRASTRSRRRSASERIHEAERIDVEFPVIGRVRFTRPDRLVFYGGLAALAAFSLIDWPVALVLAAGHALAENHHSRVARELGEALEEVG